MATCGFGSLSEPSNGPAFRICLDYSRISAVAFSGYNLAQASLAINNLAQASLAINNLSPVEGEYARIFSTTVSSPEALLVSLYRLTRDRLLYILSIPVTPSFTRSLLQFYFSCFLSFCLKGWCRFSICCNKLLLHHCKIFKNGINFNILPRKKEHHY